MKFCVLGHPINLTCPCICQATKPSENIKSEGTFYSPGNSKASEILYLGKLFREGSRFAQFSTLPTQTLYDQTLEKICFKHHIT